MIEMTGKFGPFFKCNACGHTMSKQSKGKGKSSPRPERDRDRQEFKVHGRNI
jgi:hypothetical protein